MIGAKLIISGKDWMSMLITICSKIMMAVIENIKQSNKHSYSHLNSSLI